MAQAVARSAAGGVCTSWKKKRLPYKEALRLEQGNNGGRQRGQALVQRQAGGQGRGRTAGARSGARAGGQRGFHSSSACVLPRGGKPREGAWAARMPRPAALPCGGRRCGGRAREHALVSSLLGVHMFDCDFLPIF
jgi:hypothetical protein